MHKFWGPSEPAYINLDGLQVWLQHLGCDAYEYAMCDMPHEPHIAVPSLFVPLFLSSMLKAQEPTA